MFRLFDTFRSFRFPYNIFYQIKCLPHDIKMRFQRAFRGWADCDVSNMDMWFMEVIPQMLQHLRDTSWAHPILDINVSDEENEANWNQILDRMIFLCKEMDRTSHLKQDGQCCYKQCQTEFFELFKTYFDYLWD